MNDLFDDDFLGKMKDDLVRTVVAQDNPTLDKLNQAFREEFGELASEEHIRLFEREVQNRMEATERLSTTIGADKLELIKSVAAQENPTVENLQDAVRKRFNEEASTELIEYFKLELQRKGVAQAGITAVDGRSKVALLKSVVAGDEPTPEKLEEAFRKELGIPVPPEMMALFRIEAQKKEATREGISYTEFLLREVKKKQ
ncbi:MAG: hypothetical protein ACLFOY_08465 [Desulfatibacillaceae bacterium]